MTLTCRRFALLLVVSSLGWCQQTEAAAAQSDGVFCTDIQALGKTVCGIGYFTSPSPAALEGGETIYIGGWSDFYQITNAANETTGIEITTILSDEKVCQVLVKYPEKMEPESCGSCKLCGNETTLYSADCTNLLYGRMVDCESSSGATGEIYFPLTVEALKEETTTTGGMNSTEAEVDKPMKGGDAVMNTTTDGAVDVPMEGGMNTTNDGGGMNAAEASPSPSPSSMLNEGGGVMNATDPDTTDMGGGVNVTDGDMDMGSNETDIDGGDDTDTEGPGSPAGNGDSAGTGNGAPAPVPLSPTSGSITINLGAYSSAVVALVLSSWL